MAGEEPTLECNFEYINIVPQDDVIAQASPSGIRTSALVILPDKKSFSKDQQFVVELHRNDKVIGRSYHESLPSLEEGLEVVVIVDVDPELVTLPQSSILTDQPSFLFALIWDSLLSQFNLIGNSEIGDQLVVEIPALDGTVTSTITNTQNTPSNSAALRGDEPASLYNFLLERLPQISSVEKGVAVEKVTESILGWLDREPTDVGRLIILLRWQGEAMEGDQLLSRVQTAQAKNSLATPLIILDLGQRQEKQIVTDGTTYLLPTDLMSFPEGVVAYPNPFNDLDSWDKYRDYVGDRISVLMTRYLSEIRSSMQNRFRLDKTWLVIVPMEDVGEMSLHVETTLTNGKSPVRCDRKLSFHSEDRSLSDSQGFQTMIVLVGFVTIATSFSLIFILMQWAPWLLTFIRRILAHKE